MKKALLIIGGIILVLVVIGGLAASGNPASNTDTGGNNSNTETNTTQAETQPSKEVITISNSTVKDSGFGTTEVIGEAKNNDSSKHTATLKATFYDANNKILGTASGVINDLEPGQTKTFNLITTDKITGYATFKVEVDTLL